MDQLGICSVLDSYDLLMLIYWFGPRELARDWREDARELALEKLILANRVSAPGW